MSRNDLISWLSMFNIYNPEYADWGFDEITGGESEFFEIEDYFRNERLLRKIY